LATRLTLAPTSRIGMMCGAPIPFFTARLLRPRGHQKSQLIKQLAGSGRKP
jgi:hypothetical protein